MSQQYVVVRKIDLNPHELDIVRAILRKHLAGHKIVVFGSRATGKAKPFSDLDLAVMSNAPLSYSVQADLAEDFDESDLPYKVDIVDWATAGESFRKIIRRDAVSLDLDE